MTYIYKDNSKGSYKNAKWESPIVFKCIAENINDADEQFFKAIGKIPMKLPYICCVIEDFNACLTPIQK